MHFNTELGLSASASLTTYALTFEFLLTDSRAMTFQVEVVQDLQEHSLLVRTAEGTKDAGRISKAFRNMSILCDAFQVSY